MLFVSLLQRLGFPSESRPTSEVRGSLQSPPESGGMRQSPRGKPSGKVVEPFGAGKPGITAHQSVSDGPQEQAPRNRARGQGSTLEQAATGTERRTLVKAPATSTAKKKAPASAAVKGRSVAAAERSAKPAAKKAAAAPKSKVVPATKKSSTPVKAVSAPRTAAAAKPPAPRPVPASGPFRCG